MRGELSSVDQRSLIGKMQLQFMACPVNLELSFSDEVILALASDNSPIHTPQPTSIVSAMLPGK